LTREREGGIIMEDKVHVCKTCGRATLETGHLCDPEELKEAYVCEHCGIAATDPRHICKPKLQHVNYVCIACGRVAELPGQLCNPRDIELMARQEPPTKII
jgi:DNA-directed RNA polymerase subunit RPC12/RpoP